jgi:hypothetical protein
LVERFWPIKGWTDKDSQALKNGWYTEKFKQGNYW